MRSTDAHRECRLAAIRSLERSPLDWRQAQARRMRWAGPMLDITDTIDRLQQEIARSMAIPAHLLGAP